ncbi:MAG: nickel-dependent hydrogenase large subunit, partial [Deltaproteobacteria bacterium]|nr:nickel-dependent hydrogenase large subunit [Deltaproteobacteria bacterium]
GSAASAALRSLAPVNVPPNGRLARSVVSVAEALANHLQHFYLSFAPELSLPDGVRPGLERFTPLTGSSFGPALAARVALLPVIGILAGKWPNSLALLPGGSTRPVDASELLRALGAVQELTEFLETRLLGDRTEAWLGLRGAGDLTEWLRAPAHRESDLGAFVLEALERGLDGIGRGPGAWLSCGGWESADGEPWLRPGYHDGSRQVVSFERVIEHTKHSWFEAASSGHPAEATTIPAPDRAEAYSWAKAPRYGGRPVETGPLARMICDGDPLIGDLVAVRGPGVFVRVLARLHETVRLAVQLRAWLQAIDPKRRFYRECVLPAEGTGMAAVEAPRGTLLHWLRIREGKIVHYQIVTPTAWNFSPRDDADVPGPVESALEGLPAGEGCRGAAYVVRSFDPCLYCSVH